MLYYKLVCKVVVLTEVTMVVRKEKPTFSEVTIAMFIGTLSLLGVLIATSNGLLGKSNLVSYCLFTIISFFYIWHIVSAFIFILENQ